MRSFWCLFSVLGNSAFFLTGAAAGGAIALINSIGNLGGFFGPYIVGYIKDITGSFNISMISLGISMILASLIIVFLVKQTGKALIVNNTDKSSIEKLAKNSR